MKLSFSFAIFSVLLFVTLKASAASPLARDLRALTDGLVEVTDGITCSRLLESWSDGIAHRTPAELAEEVRLSSLDVLLANFFRARQSVRERLRTLSQQGLTKGADDCVRFSRRVLAQLRSFEDVVALSQVRAPEAIAANPTSLRGTSPWLLANGPVRLRSGDVLLSRGNAFVSAAIARIGQEEGQFSHLAQIYIDAPAGTEIAIEDAAADGRVSTIEAHIEVGSFTRPFRDYVADANARVVQFRPRESSADAHAAAASIFHQVRAYQAARRAADHRDVASPNDNPPYDFRMDLGNSDEIFCAEIVSLAQSAVGRHVPTYPSLLKRNDVTKRLGIEVTETFAPSDLDVDPGFELLAEWRDLAKLAEVRKKDSVFHAIYRWMDETGAQFHLSALDQSKALFAWTVRQSDRGYLDRLPKNMSPSMIAMTFVIDRVGAVLQKRVEEFEQRFGQTNNGLAPFLDDEVADLDAFRKEDAALFRAGRPALFQWDLR